jgi:16S rRNA (uracil1498-N3)-methyltransferase
MALPRGPEERPVVRRLYLDPADLARGEGAELHLDPIRGRRLRDVLRLRIGATLAVFDGQGREHEGRVTAMTGNAVTLTLGAALTPLPEPPVPVVIVCAFPRSSRGDWLVEKATELGVVQLVPLEADRSVMHPGEGRIERWQRIAVEAAEQCGRACIPFVGGEAPSDALHIVADPEAGDSIRDCFDRLGAVPRAVAVHIGPEGGWTDDELSALDARGALRVSLGPRLLRVETAAILAAAQVLDATGGLKALPGTMLQSWL